MTVEMRLLSSGESCLRLNTLSESINPMTLESNTYELGSYSRMKLLTRKEIAARGGHLFRALAPGYPSLCQGLRSPRVSDSCVERCASAQSPSLRLSWRNLPLLPAGPAGGRCGRHAPAGRCWESANSGHAAGLQYRSRRHPSGSPRHSRRTPTG